MSSCLELSVNDRDQISSNSLLPTVVTSAIMTDEWMMLQCFVAHVLITLNTSSERKPVSINWKTISSNIKAIHG